MNKVVLLKQLDKATDLVVTRAIEKGTIVQLSKNLSFIGNIIIKKNSKGYYDILSLNKKILYEDIIVFDIAVIIAQKYSAGEISSIKQVLDLEEKFSKHYIDMLHYLNCIKSAKKQNDIERMAILEDKFQMSEVRAKLLRNKISSFKKTK